MLHKAPFFIAVNSTVLYAQRMARNDPQVNLRLPAELKDQLDGAATANKRSLTAEVVRRLDDSFTLDQVSDFPGFSAADKASMLHSELERAREKLNNSIELPDSLRKRIDRRASETGRTSQEELTLALEKAFPPASETDQMIQLLDEVLSISPSEKDTVAADGIRQYLQYLKEERDAGRAEGARARLNDVFAKGPDGKTVRVK